MHRLTNGTKQVYLGWRRLRHGCSRFDIQLERLKYATTIHQRRHEAIVIQRDHHFTEQRVPREPVRNRRYRQPCPVSCSCQIFVTSRSVSARPREPVKPEHASQLSHTPCPEFSRTVFWRNRVRVSTRCCETDPLSAMESVTSPSTKFPQNRPPTKKEPSSFAARSPSCDRIVTLESLRGVVLEPGITAILWHRHLAKYTY